MAWLDRILHKGTRPRTPRFDAALQRAREEEHALAIQRYRYMARTAQPETLERAYEEAFARLTPEQRGRVSSELQRVAPPEDTSPTRSLTGDDPALLARLATRAEHRQPGSVERALESAGAGALLASFATAFADGHTAQSFFATSSGTGGGALGAEPDEDNPDFSPEFGQGPTGEGFAGGAGFEDEGFDVEV